MHATTSRAEPAHTNRLIRATSPYLIQHAHNPVDWFEWGSEALDKAKAEDKPIFLSIGYSACHWCHVMERESFENEDIAAVLNEHFVCIKVDREERPDLDDIYMMATQALTRSGGWPMSVWLTPDQRPFYAGTYFPPESRWGRPGFKELLLAIARVWREERQKVLHDADALTSAVKQLTTVEPGADIVSFDAVSRAAGFFAQHFDGAKGGISGGGTNKFPPSMTMDLMLRVYHGSMRSTPPEARLLELVELTLDRMAHGGIYDQLGGGICRYSTDVDWLVPHFEKMLYDQALVSDIYLKAYQLTKKPLYRRIASEIFDYVIADLQSPEGGFYCTRDADSEGEEGKFYVWTRDDVERLLGEDAGLFCDYYDVSEAGNWEGHNILNISRPLETVAKLRGVSIEDAERRLAGARRILFDAREQRIKPHRDEKVLAAWNGLMIAAMAKGYRILDEPKYRDAAVKAAEFVLTHMRDENGRLLRTWRDGRRHTLGYLDDHAFMIEALLNLYETTFEMRWLREAEALNAQVMAHFRDDAEGGFFFTSDEAEQVLVRAKSANDNAIPSGSSVQLMNLLRLSVLLDRKDLADEAERMIRVYSPGLQSSPFSSERLLCAIDFYHRRPREFAFVCSSRDTDGADRLADAAWQAYVPNAVFAMRVEDGPGAADIEKRIPLLAGKTALDGMATVYVCRDYACQAPTTDAAVMLSQIEK